jgi:hypothetical protein
MSDGSKVEGKAQNIVLDTPPDEHVPPLDPTINVQNLLRAAIIRVDDLRDAEIRRVSLLVESSRLLAAAEQRRVDEKIAAEQRRVDEQMELRQSYERALREAEAKRIDAIRVVDVNAVSVANERAAAQAQVLANQVSASAETLRALVATTASTAAQQFAQVTGQLSDRLALLEKSSYEGKGREAYSDPIYAQLVAEVKALTNSQSQGAGRGAGLQAGWAILTSAVVLIGGILAIVVFLTR